MSSTAKPPASVLTSDAAPTLTGRLVEGAANIARRLGRPMSAAALGLAMLGFATPAAAQIKPTGLSASATVDQNSQDNAIELGWSGSVDDSIDMGVDPSCWFAGGSPVGTLHYFYFDYPATYASYTPPAGWTGTTSFQYHCGNAFGSSSSPGTATITVRAVASPPTGGNVSVTTAYQTQTAFTVPAGGNYHSMNVTSGPSNAAQFDYVVPNVSYTPRAGFYGTDSFTYTLSGPGGTSPTYTGTITVTAPAPTVGNVSASTDYQTSVSFGPSLGGGPATKLDVGVPSNGTASVSGMSLVYTPKAGFSGTDGFAYSATGPGGRSADAYATVTVGPPPLPPAPGASNVSVSTPYETAVSVGFAPSGDYWAIQAVSNPSSGSMSWPGGSGTTGTYTPYGGFYGTDSFTYRATGPGGNSPTRTVTVTVSAPPAPGAGNVSASTDYNTAVNIALTPSGVYDSVARVANPSNGSVSISGTTATYTPNGGFIGADSFTYRASGPGGSSPTRTVTVTVAPPAAPVARNIAATTAYGQDATFAVDVIGGPTTSISTSGLTIGSLAVSGLNLTYTPFPGFHGIATFNYQATGPGGASGWAQGTITVLPPPPTAAGVSANVPFETPTTFPHGATGEISGVTIISQPSYGTASVVAGELTYQPNAGYYGADSFTYRATGPGGNSAPATVSVTVGLPPAPTASDTTLTTTFEIQQSKILPVAGILTEINIVTPPAHGAASVVGTTLTYTPENGYLGADSLTYNATGPGGASQTRTVTITVNPPALPTVAATTLTTAYQTPGSAALTATGYKATIAVVTPPTHGTASISGATANYTPDAGYYGPDSFTVVSTNVAGSSAPATVTVTVGLPPAPTVAAATLTTAYETAGAADLTASGVFSGLAIATGPTHGTAAFTGNRLTYTPDALHYGADSLTYQAVGPGGVSAPATVTITVGLPGAPSISAATLTTAYETTGSVDMAASGVYSALEIATGPAHGAASIAGDRLTYTPDALHYGADSLTVRAVGPGGNSAPATVTITVGNPPAPTISAATLTTAYETTGTVTLTPSGIATSLEVVTAPSNGSASISGATLTYTPAALHYGADSLTVRAVGPGGNSTPATVTITVGLPPAPVATALPLLTPFETPGTVTLAATGRASSFALVDTPAHGTVTLAGAVAQYTPNAGYYGADSFTFTATGPGGTSSPATVTVGVALPGQPVASPDSIATPYETPGTVTLRATGTFDDFQIVTAPTHGTATISGAVVTFTPSAGYYGADSFTFTASGPGGVSNPATVAITVGNPPAPSISAATVNTAYETAGSIDLAASGVFTRLEVETPPAHGTASIAGDRLTYTPNARHFGADSLTVWAVGPGGNSVPATVAITVGLPPAPGASAVTLNTAYETAGSIDLAPSGHHAALEVETPPAHGTASITGDRLTYTPSAGYHGADSLTYRAVGPGGVSAPATVAVTVASPAAPSAASATLTTAYETAGGVDLAASGVYSALEIVTGPAHGTASIAGDRLTYTPSPGYFGADGLTVRAVGPGGHSAPATVAITVGLPGLPTVEDVTVTTAMDFAVEVELTASGVNSGLQLTSQPAHGSAVLNGQTVTYTPSPAFFGTDSFSYVAVGPAGNSAPATVTVVVDGGPPPVADDTEKAGLTGDPIVFDVTAGMEGGPFTAVRLEPNVSTGASPSSHHGGTVRVEGLRIIFTPAANWTGTASFRFSVENRYGWSAPAVATAVIKPRPTTGAVIEAETWAGRAVDVTLTANAQGGPFTGADIVSATPADALDLAVQKVGESYVLTATPRGQAFGLVEIRYTLRNAYSVSEPGLVRLMVRERPDPSRDAEVTGLVNAQTQAAYRFSAAQMTNVLRRLEQLHGDGPRRNHVGLSLVSRNELDVIPGDNEAMRAMRDYMEKAGMIEHGPAGAPVETDAPRSATGASQNGRVAWWMEGAIDLGFKRRDEVREGFQFTTDGLTAGADAKVSETLTVGVGAGFGRDESDVGSKGTKSSAEATSGFAYASWQPREKLFVDGVLGYSSMSFDATRYVTQTGDLLESRRNGRQVFGVVSAGYEHRGRRLHWSPYGRVEFSDVTLGGFQETGDDLWSLEFDEQRTSQVRAALGVHGDYLIRYRAGDLKPTFRVEYLHDLKNGGRAGVRYADWLNSPDYRVELAPYDDRNIRLGFGLIWQAINGSAFGLEYESTVINSAGQEGRVRLDFSTRF